MTTDHPYKAIIGQRAFEGHEVYYCLAILDKQGSSMSFIFLIVNMIEGLKF